MRKRALTRSAAQLYVSQKCFPWLDNTQVCHFETNCSTIVQPNKPVFGAQYPVRQVVTSFHDIMNIVQLDGSGTPKGLAQLVVDTTGQEA